jgi:hypothetical protein
MIKQAHRLNAESSALRASYAQPPDISRSGRKAKRIASVVMLFVASDGTGYVEYEVRNVVNNVITSDNLYLQQIAPTDNNFPTTLLSSTTQNQTLLPGPIVPDGQGGILATWTISPSSGPVPQYPYQAVDVVAGVVGTPYNLPFSPKNCHVRAISDTCAWCEWGRLRYRRRRYR